MPTSPKGSDVTILAATTAPALIEPRLIDYTFIEGHVTEDCGCHVRVTFYRTKRADCGGIVRIAVSGVTMTKHAYVEAMAKAAPKCMDALMERTQGLIVVN